MELAVRSGVSRNLPFPVHTTWGITTMLVVIPPITCAFGSACRWPGGTMRLTDPLAVTDATSIRTTFIVPSRSEEHTSELQSQSNLVCRLLLEKKKKKQ